MFSIRKIFERNKNTEETTLNTKKIENYTHYMELPMKIAGCRDWYPKPTRETHTIINNVYVCLVLFVLTDVQTTIFVNLYIEWKGIMASLHELADSLPFLTSVAIIGYFALYREEMYELIDFMKNNFEYYSANGLTNMTMVDSYKAAKKFGYFYTACAMFSVTMYVIPEFINLWMKEHDHHTSEYLYKTFMLILQCLAQAFIGLAMGQLGVLFAANSILLCGQLDLLCCSLRNVRYTALLRSGVSYDAIASKHADIRSDELHNYMYNTAEMKNSAYHYDNKMNTQFVDKTTSFDIYSSRYDSKTNEALRDCARVCQIVSTFKDKFEKFVSPLLVMRVVQVTLYNCTLLYAATSRFDMATAEYLAAVTFDTFVYCYYGNQIITQADRVSTAAYQSAWHTMGSRPRRLLLNVLLANRRPVIVRAGRFLPMDLHTFIVIIKTSFSYYTLLVNVNEKHE